MSRWSNAGNIKLGRLIELLRSMPQHAIVRNGFANPHSYRGYYEDLAFEPANDMRVELMLEIAENALEHTYIGWKGGEYTMTADTDCWLARSGETGVPMVDGGEQVYVISREAWEI